MSEKNQIVVVLIVALVLGGRTSQRSSSVSGSCSRLYRDGLRFGSTAEA